MPEELLEGRHGHGGMRVKPTYRRSYTLRPSRRQKEVMDVVRLKAEQHVRQDGHPRHAVPLVLRQVGQDRKERLERRRSEGCVSMSGPHLGHNHALMLGQGLGQLIVAWSAVV